MKYALTIAALCIANLLFAQASVSGRCTTVSGQAVANIQVTAILFDDKQSTTTASDGSFEFPTLNPGDWTLMIENNGRKTVRKVTVKTTPVNLNIVVGKQD